MSNIDLSALKSAEVIDDVDKICGILTAKKSPGHTLVFEEDGRARVDKSIGGGKSPITLSSAEMQSAAEKVGLEWKDDYIDRVIAFWASDERVDRHGDIVRQNWIFDSFEKNPVIPYGHDWSAPPIGNALRWSVEERKDADYVGPALLLHTFFAPPEVCAFADRIFRLVKAGLISTCSVGFYPMKVIDVKDKEERQRLGLGPNGYILDENELVENSVVPIPANTGAVSLLRSMKDKVDPGDLIIIREFTRQQIERGPGDATAFRRADTRWRNIWKSVFPDAIVEDHAELDVPFAIAESANDPVVAAIEKLHDRLDAFEETMQEAIDDLTLVKEVNPADPEGDSPLSSILAMSGDIAKAASAFKG